MARLMASRRNYKRAFEKHINSIQNWKTTDNKISRMLLLSYAVECGLKYLAMKKEKINRINTTDAEIQDYLSTHNIARLLELAGGPTMRFTTFKTQYGDVVNCENFHQFCRYGIEEKDNGTKQFEVANELEDIIKWLREEGL